MNKEDLINKVIDQISIDIYTDIEALEELLRFVPVENLIGYLPEEYWKDYEHLININETKV